MILANLAINLRKTNGTLTALVEAHVSSAVCAHIFTIIHDFPYSPTKQILYDIFSLTLCARFEVEINLQTRGSHDLYNLRVLSLFFQYENVG